RAAGRAAHRLATTLLAGFATVALLLATLGVYGLVGTAVGERTREFGIRVSLGAQSRDILRLVFGQALTLISIGAALGFAAALALTRVVSSLLVGVRPTDPITFGAVVTLLAALGCL